MELLGPIQAIALRNALSLHRETKDLSPDENYFVRRVCRWYSKTFSTPLHEVEGLPWEHVLLAFFEEQYEQRTPEELEQIRDLLIEDPAQAARKALDNDFADLDAYEIGLEELKAKAKQQGAISKDIKFKSKAETALEYMSKHDRQAPTLGGAVTVEAPPPIVPAELPPDISFKFEDFGDEDDRDTLGILSLPKKK